MHQLLCSLLATDQLQYCYLPLCGKSGDCKSTVQLVFLHQTAERRPALQSTSEDALHPIIEVAMSDGKCFNIVTIPRNLTPPGKQMH